MMLAARRTTSAAAKRWLSWIQERRRRKKIDREVMAEENTGQEDWIANQDYIPKGEDW